MVDQPYKFRYNEPGVIRISDGAVILPDLAGFNWRQYLDWMYDGGMADPAEEPVAQPRRLAKETIVERLTDEELELFKTAKPLLSARQIFLWDEALYNEINPDDQRLVDAFTGIIGAVRTAVVLS